MSDVLKRDLVVSRDLDVPVRDAWRMWTEPDLVATWWGPQDYSSPACEIDLRVGGRYLFCMRAPEAQGGQDLYSVGTYQVIRLHERLEFTQSFADVDGNLVPAAAFGMLDMPDEVQTVVTFEALGDSRTLMTITQYEQPVDRMFEYAVAGWSQSFDKMAQHLDARATGARS